MDTEDERPWEQPGNIRRDWEPHRASFLWFPGEVSFFCGLFCLCCPPFSLLCVPLAIVVLVSARNDLGKMAGGMMDPSGKARTQEAWDSAVFGLNFSILAWVSWGIILLCYLF